MRSLYPQYDLRTVVRYLNYNPQGVRNAGRIKREELSILFGFTSASGMAITVISSMVHYGLLENFNGYYTFSNTAKTLADPKIDSKKRDGLLLKAALSPAIFKSIHEIKSPVTTQDIMDKYDIQNTKAATVLHNYQRSLRFAQQSTRLSASTSQANAPLAFGESMVSGRKEQQSGSVMIDLGGGKVVELPKEIILEAVQAKLEELSKIREQLIDPN